MTIAKLVLTVAILAVPAPKKFAHSWGALVGLQTVKLAVIAGIWLAV